MSIAPNDESLILIVYWSESYTIEIWMSIASLLNPVVICVRTSSRLKSKQYWFGDQTSSRLHPEPVVDCIRSSTAFFEEDLVVCVTLVLRIRKASFKNEDMAGSK